MISFADVSIGDGGTTCCTRCVALSPREFLSQDQVLARVSGVVSGWDAGPGPNVAFGGPEPFEYPGLPDIVAGAAAVGVQRIRLRTDGGALSVDGNASGVIHAGVRHIELVVLGGQAVHDELSAVPGLFAAAIQGASAFRSAAHEARATVAVTGSITVCRHNLAALPGAVAALAEMGAVAVELLVKDGAAKSAGLRQWVTAAAETGMVNGVWVYVRSSTEELAPAIAPAIGLHALAPSSRWGV